MTKVEFDEEKIIYKINSIEIQMLWNEIWKIYCYKYDYITYEKACLVINYENGEFIEIIEDTNGWSELANNIHLYLPIKEKEWYEVLMRSKSRDISIEIYKREIQCL